MLKLLVLSLGFLSFAAFAQFTPEQEEQSYLRFMKGLQSKNAKSLVALTVQDQKLLVDAIWDAQEELNIDVKNALETLVEEEFNLYEQLRLAVIAHRAGEVRNWADLEAAIITGLSSDKELAILVASLKLELYEMNLDTLVEQALATFPEETSWVSVSERPVGDQTALARDLWDHATNLSEYINGKYEGGVKIYMFCRTKRTQPCLMAVRDQDNNPVYYQGKLWTQPSLASSARNIPSYQRNGNTPAGVLSIDGVMPAADQQISFGKFRRLILNFLPGQQSERATRSLLPQSSIESDWWKPANVARDVGRNLLRIHGTGKMNQDPSSSWFPFMRTSGCIAQRENTYDGITYKDQRELLNVLMEAQGLDVSYANEAKIKGMLFVIEIDDKNSAVTPRDLAAIGIK
ncbi:MAG: hypothetical protein ACLGG7_10560 [Bacteriovoracia bacterium]